MEPHLIGSIVTLLLIACMVAMAAEWMKQPYSIALVLVGLVVAVTNITPAIHISHDVVFTLLLPPLLFQGALHMDMERLFKNWKAIALLAIPGVVCSTFLIGFVLHKLWPMDFIYALLFGALITPTDPISVLKILKKVGAPERLRIILEGESLFNDGTGVVIFTIILGMITGSEEFQLGANILKFLTVAGGGTLLGILIGYCVYRILKNLNNHLLEVTITVVMTFGTPLLAESMHLSGIIAIVVAGLIIGNYGRVNSMSGKTRETLETFWEVIDFLINSILFLIIGIELQEILKSPEPLNFSLVGWAILAVGVSRCLVVYPLIGLRNKFFHESIPSNWRHIMFWGGLKGSISIALVVGLPLDFPFREKFLMVAFFVVLFSLVIQGLTMKPLVQKLDLSKE